MRQRLPFVPSRGNSAGLTLAELLIGVSIAMIMLYFAYEGLNRAIVTRKTVFAESETMGAVRAGIELISRDIRCAYVSPFFHDPSKTFLTTTFTGYPDRFYLFTVSGGAGFGISEVEYFVEGGLKRRFKKIPDGNAGAGGVVEEISGDVTAMKIRYFDRKKWTRTWGLDKNTGMPVQELSNMPAAVEVVITVLERGSEEEISVIIPVMCASFTYGI